MESTEERLRPLMVASLAGDERAYRLLLQDLARLLRGYYARRLDDRSAAEDLVQETLIAIHTRRATYDAGRPVTAWLHAIARYKLIDHLRRGNRHATLPLDETSQAFLATDEAEAADGRHDLDTALGTLPPLQQSLIRAVRLEGRSIADVSAASGLSQSAVKVTIHRALKRLSARFGGGGEP